MVEVVPLLRSAPLEEELADEPPVYHSDFDPEVAAIFTDEATELIEVSQTALGDWRSRAATARICARR